MNKAHEERENANKEFEKMLEKYDRWVLVKREKRKERRFVVYVWTDRCVYPLYMFGRTEPRARCIGCKIESR